MLQWSPRGPYAPWFRSLLWPVRYCGMGNAECHSFTASHSAFGDQRARTIFRPPLQCQCCMSCSIDHHTLAAATAQRTRLATSLPTHSPTLRNNRRELPCLPPRNACGFKPSAHCLTACSRLTVLTSCFPSARPYPRIHARPLIPVPDMWREGGSASQPGCRAPPTIAAVGRSVPWHVCASPPNGAIRYLETATIAP
jgi:hypothetical protein